jgi:hypothetical protein
MTMQQILKEREVNRYGIEIETTVLSIYANASLSFALFRSLSLSFALEIFTFNTVKQIRMITDFS